MNRKELLRLLVNQAQFNGFEFRPWFQTHVQPVWPGAEPALELLAGEGRHYTLLFSHTFARCFWRTGAHISFMVPAVTYPRVNAQGKTMLHDAKAIYRRTIKPDVWKYHRGRWPQPRTHRLPMPLSACVGAGEVPSAEEKPVGCTGVNL